MRQTSTMEGLDDARENPVDLQIEPRSGCLARVNTKPSAVAIDSQPRCVGPKQFQDIVIVLSARATNASKHIKLSTVVRSVFAQSQPARNSLCCESASGAGPSEKTLF